ncbi:MAG: hypothetical protein LBI05_11100 [Planctomycetaceae bacterium]|jgi:hypothetical protein|nr:hypothetical protein [Planctomycetaceae bacterium]
MHAPTNLIEDIRTALAFSEQVTPDKLEVYAREYAEECTKLNNRLRQCLPHLRDGNIAEAVRLAEASPNITETFNLLDFESRQDWVEVCDGLGFDVPPPLAVEVFQELNDAYLQMVPLEPLLKWHRLLALNGSPIRDRLSVLRSIAKADPMNLHWQTDQETFERVRISELGKEVTQSLAQDDMPQLQELYRELTAPGWRIAPPPEYRQSICTAVLKKHADMLMQHFNAFNYPAAQAEYQSMQNVLFTDQMAMPPAIERNIRAAVQWLGEEESRRRLLAQFKQELAALQEALDVYTPRETLENFYFALSQTAVQANLIIPKEIESHYQSRVNYLESVEKNRYRIVMTIFAGSILLVAAFVVYALMDRSFSEQVTQSLETLQKIETENKIDDIEQAFKGIPPKVKESPKVAAVMTRLQGLLDKDNERAAEFSRYHKQANELIDQNSDDWEALHAAKASVEQADKLKRTPQEITQITDLRSKYNQKYRDKQTEDDRKFSVQFVKHSQEFNNLPSAPDARFPKDELIAQLKTLTENVDNLLIQFPNISDKQKQEWRKLSDSIANRQQTIQRTSEANEAFSQMVSQIRNLQSCKRALESFSTKFPNHPATDDIKNVLKNFEQMQEAVESLQTLCQSFTASAIDDIRLKRDAATIKSQFDAAVSKMADIELVFSPAPEMPKVANMKPIDDSTFKVTEELLKTIARRDLYPWIDSDQWYYLIVKPLDDEGKRTGGKFEYVTALTSTPKSYTLTSKNEERNKENYGLLQSRFSNDALIQLDKIMNDPNVQKDAAEIIGNLLDEMNKAPGIDPILKIILLHQFISDYSKVDPIFAENYTRVIKLIDDGGVDLSTNWMDVEARTTVSQRQKATVMLNRLLGIADLSALVDKTKQETNAFRQKMFDAKPRFEFVGLLTRQDRQWSCSPIGSFPSPNGKLFVLRMVAEKVQPVQVGTVRENTVTLSSSINVLQCSPVFFVN